MCMPYVKCVCTDTYTHTLCALARCSQSLIFLPENIISWDHISQTPLLSVWPCDWIIIGRMWVEIMYAIPGLVHKDFHGQSSILFLHSLTESRNLWGEDMKWGRAIWWKEPGALNDSMGTYPRTRERNNSSVLVLRAFGVCFHIYIYILHKYIHIHTHSYLYKMT